MASLFKQITVLRKEGKLEEALALTNECFETYDNAEWTKKAAVWVYFELLKVAFNKKDFAKAKEWIACFDALELDDAGIAEKNFNVYRYKINGGGPKMKDGKFVDDEDYISALKEYEELAKAGLNSEQQTEYGWTIYKFIKQQSKAQQPDLELVNHYLTIYTNFGTKESSSLHSSMLVFAIKFSRNRNVDVFGFLKNWNWKLIRKEDRDRYVTPEGKSYDSTCEKALQTYAKLLLDKLEFAADEEEKEAVEEDIFKFMDILDRYITEFPENHWLLFGRVRLLLALGSEEDMSEDIFTLVRAKSNEYWIWDLLGTHHLRMGESSLAMASYCKGLMCKTEPEMQTALREKLIEVLLPAKMYNEAKTELDLILAVKNAGGYKVSKKLTEWAESDWYKEAKGSRHNYDLYKKTAPAAMSVLWAHLPSHVGVIVGINEEKEIAQYIVSKELSGNFKLKQAAFKSKLGVVVEVFVEEKTSPDGTVWYKAVHVQKTDKKPSKEIFKEIDDLAKVLPTGIGFTQTTGVFIPQQLIEEHNLSTGDIIYGTAVISYNKKKDEWGWKMLSIND